MNRAERRRIAKQNSHDREERREIAKALLLQDQAEREAEANRPGDALTASGFEVVHPQLLLPPETESRLKRR